MNKEKMMPTIRFDRFTSNWERKSISSLMVFSNGINAPKENYGKGRKMISVMDILSNEPMSYSNIRNAVKVDTKIENNNKVEEGDIVFVRSSEVRDEVGWAKAYLDKEYALFSGFAIRGKKVSEFDALFLELSINGKNRYQIERKAGGSTRYNVSQLILKNLEITQPTLIEQNKISSLFKKIADIILLQQQLLNDYRQLKKALLQQLFPQKEEKVPKVRFAGFRDYWEEKTLGKISNMYQPTTIGKNDLLDSGVPVFGANGYIGYYSVENHNSSQVTISARGENAGNPSYVKGPVWITGNSMVINIDENPEIDKYFLYQSLLSSSLKKFVTGGAQPQLTRNILEKVPIKKPSFKEQEKIGQFFKQLDETIEGHEQKLATYQDLKKALLQRMFV